MEEFNFLKRIIGKEKFALLIFRIEQHSRFNSVDFEIIHLDNQEAVIRVLQDKSFNSNYFDSKRLYEIAVETFEEVLAPRKIKTHPKPFIKSPIDVITPSLIKR